MSNIKAVPAAVPSPFTTPSKPSSSLSSATTPSSPLQSSSKPTSTIKSSSSSDTIHHPTSLLPTPLAQTYTHIHPVLVLGLFYLSFSAIVKDPVAAMSWLSVVVAGAQAVYCVVCLPVASAGQVKEEAGGGKGRSGAAGAGGLRKRLTGGGGGMGGVRSVQQGIGGGGTAWWPRVVTSLLSTILTLALSTPLLFLLLVLHGAPLTSHHAHTFLLALHLSLLAILPLFYTHGVSGPRWRDLVSLSAPVDEVLGGAMGALVGAWVGAIPIPLDWDREWQRWPVTVLVGSVGGWAVGRVVGGLFKGRRVDWGI